MRNPMTDILKNNLLNAQYTPDWLVDTGNLRQIGKTTAILEIVKEIGINFSDSRFYPPGFKPWEVVIAVPTQDQMFHILRMSDKVGAKNFSCAPAGALERHLRQRDNVILLVDEGRYIPNLREIVAQAGDRIVRKHGWW